VETPFITVAVCTRDRPGPLADCLRALQEVDYPADAYEVVVVDNAPSTEHTAALLAGEHRWARYVREPRPGLDWARNRAIAEARGEIIAYTDDDVIVDRTWLRAIARAFAESPDAECVTGLVVPHSLETEAERLFERYGGFGRGWQRRWFGYPYHLPPGTAYHHGAGQFGTGANMAFRRRVFGEIGAFDPALDVGTRTNGGGDLEMYFRLVQEGRLLVYDPRVAVRHQHRNDLPGLYRQIGDWGIGFFSYIYCSVERYPREAPAFRALVRWWWRQYVLRRTAKAVLRPERMQVPTSLVLQEPRGMAKARERYRSARERANALAADASVGPPPAVRLPSIPSDAAGPRADLAAAPVAVRMIDLTAPLDALDGLDAFPRVRIYFSIAGTPIGVRDLANGGRTVSVAEQREAAAEVVAYHVSRTSGAPLDVLLRPWLTDHEARPSAARPARRPALASPPPVTASVVIATRDRPDDLRRCLASLAAQVTTRQFEVVVVDNNPASGAAAAVAAEFPGTRVVPEPRPGLSVARNAGVRHATGEVVLMTDDDVVAPAHWVERLTAPFADPAVGGATGNVFPRELETASQQRFEQYGGLGRGFDYRRYEPSWLRARARAAAPTWELGATANAAFRRALFDDPRVGYLDEALGAGTATGCSEDTDLFYRVLRAGWVMIYEPDAYVWHTHRRDPDALERQLYGYSKGHVAYHLTTLLEYGDYRALYHLGVTLPKWHARNVAAALLRRRDYPLRLTLLEIAGNLAGPWALVRARRAARRHAVAPVASDGGAPPPADG
jgi:GT2 family glycosyltransferase